MAVGPDSELLESGAALALAGSGMSGPYQAQRCCDATVPPAGCAHKASNSSDPTTQVPVDLLVPASDAVLHPVALLCGLWAMQPPHLCLNVGGEVIGHQVII